MGRPLIVFRTEASAAIGGGHVMRCLAVAKAVARLGPAPVFAVDEETSRAVPALARSGFRLSPPEPRPCAAALFDGYRLGVEEEAAWAGLGAYVGALDDAPGRRHACQLLIDPGPTATPEAYEPFVPPGSRLLFGPAYAPMDPAFALARAEALGRRKAAGPVRRVLVSTGLTDPGSAAIKVVEALRSARAVERIDVAVGSAAASVPALKQLDEPRLRLHLDAPDMAALTAAADLAIGAAGVSTWERCALGLPSIVVTTADNQAGNASALAKAGAAIVLGPAAIVTPELIAEAVLGLDASPERRTQMSRAAAALCDGRGAERIAQALLEGATLS